MNCIIKQRITNAEIRVAKLRKEVDHNRNMAKICIMQGYEERGRHYFHLAELTEKRITPLQNEINSAK